MALIQPPGKALNGNHNSMVNMKFSRLRSQQRDALRQTEHLFQTLLHGAFRGEG